MSEVTKPKHPGRVAQGHKLVALNRDRKKGLKAEQPAEQSSRATFYGGGAVAILVGVGFALYLYRVKKPIPVAHPLESSDDIFCMN